MYSFYLPILLFLQYLIDSFTSFESLSNHHLGMQVKQVFKYLGPSSIDICCIKWNLISVHLNSLLLDNWDWGCVLLQWHWNERYHPYTRAKLNYNWLGCWRKAILIMSLRLQTQRIIFYIIILTIRYKFNNCNQGGRQLR